MGIIIKHNTIIININSYHQSSTMY